MNILNSSRNGYEELLPSHEQSPRDNKCRSVLKSFAVVGTICFVGVIVLTQLTRQKEGQEFLRMTSAGKGDILLTVEHGRIRGTTLLSRDGRSFLAFIGVPFAKPPTGNLRFAPPQNLDPWDPRILDARSAKPQCIQILKNDDTENARATGSEDCLYLSIYTPKTQKELSNRRNRFPVIVYAHGGVHNGNGSVYGADYFMDEDVVLVILQYRLHVFGDSLARGNFAVKDQVMALKWVQNNIGEFGGNKRKVTLYGTSYGSMMISVHLLSPMSKGLFHQAIMQTGSLLSVKNKGAGRKEAEKLAEKLHCPINTSEALLNCFRQTDAGALTLATRGLNFAITIEPKSDNPSEDSCLPDEPLELIQAGEFISVPTIHGVVSAENLFTAFDILFSLNESDLATSISDGTKNEVIQKLMVLEKPITISTSELVEYQEDFSDYYIRSWNLTRDTLLQNLTNLLSDREWIHPMSVYVRNQLNAQKQRRKPIFLYYFTKESNSSYASSYKERWGEPTVPFGVQHADDLQYFLPTSRFPRIPPDSVYYNFSKFFVKTWVKFARTGKPTDKDDPVEWKALEQSDAAVPFNWFELDDTPRMFEPYGLHDRIKFWDSFNLTHLYI